MLETFRWDSFALLVVVYSILVFLGASAKKLVGKASGIKLRERIVKIALTHLSFLIGIYLSMRIFVSINPHLPTALTEPLIHYHGHSSIFDVCFVLLVCCVMAAERVLFGLPPIPTRR